jgi:NitT/TauT family transport system permease protein
MAVDPRDLDLELAGLDALERALGTGPGRARRAWRQVWPKLAAVGLALLLWQLVVWSHWKPDYVLPGPGHVFPDLWDLIRTSQFWDSVIRTMRRGVTGFALATVIGSIVGLVVARVSVLRTAVGSMITGLQTMPSVAWFPLAILLFKLGEGAILFVVVLGAAPSVANGLISGIDHVPPIYLRAGRVLGARGIQTYRHVVLPAALPAFIGGLKQGWAFAWRSLLAGELIATVPGKTSIGTGMNYARELNDTSLLISYMIVLLVIGIVIDAIFGKADTTLRRRWGLLERN